MKKIQIKGKDYVPVNERIMYFRGEDEYKGWAIVTEIFSCDENNVVMKAYVINPEGMVIATGHGQEYAGSTFINKTSYVENCETSAIGRALGAMGIGIDTAMASFEEVANAVTQQDDKRPWLNHQTFDQAIQGMNTMTEKSDREDAYKHMDETYKMKKEYRRQLLEVVEVQDIKV